MPEQSILIVNFGLNINTPLKNCLNTIADLLGTNASAVICRRNAGAPSRLDETKA